MRNRVSGVPKKTVRVTLPTVVLDRVELLGRVAELDRDELLERAVLYYDRAVCARVEGATIVARHKNKRREDFTP